MHLCNEWSTRPLIRVPENEPLLFRHLVHRRANTAAAVSELAAPGERHPVDREGGAVVDHERRGIQSLRRAQRGTCIG
jgi:hypothetical protein